METQEKSISDQILGWISGDTKPEITINTVVGIDNTTFSKLLIGGVVLIVGGIALSQFLLRATLRRFFAK